MLKQEKLLPHVFSKIDEDYSFLIGCLREVLKDAGDESLAVCLPGGDSGKATPALDPAKEMHILSIVFQLLNLVEENATAQARRIRESEEGLLREPGLFGQAFRQLQKAGFSEAQVSATLARINVEPVLTAHPTETKRTTILQIHRSIYLLLVQLENNMWTPMERDVITTQIRAHLERLLRTGELLPRKPEVSSELDNVLYYLTEVFPHALAKLDDRLSASWKEAGFDSTALRDPASFPRLTFGDWVGGDRDGHPLVTADVTRDTLRKLSSHAVRMIGEHLKTLLQRLSLSAEIQDPPALLLDALKSRLAVLGRDSALIAFSFPKEPWRQYVAVMIKRLEGHVAGEPWAYHHTCDLLSDLNILNDSLQAIGARLIAESDLRPVVRLVHVFGLHLASLDIRQNSRFHSLAIGQLMRAAGFADHDFVSWDESRRLTFLLGELQSPRPFTTPNSEVGAEAKAVLSCYQVLGEHIALFGTEGLGSLIVSMTRSAADLLAVYVLMREAGLLKLEDDGLSPLLPVVPLFETLDDLEAAPNILREFLTHPITRRAQRRAFRPEQQVMVGYSDSNKDGGYFASQWRLHQAQLRMTEAARAVGVELSFFHGRGGTPSRGAGPTHRFLEALPHGSLTGGFRMTEQGETIAQKYANVITATYNLELLLAGVTATTLKHSTPAAPDPTFVHAMERLTEYSREAYTALVQAPGFIDYWSQATPIDALERSTIGSRPSRRTGTRSLEDLRAIPWVFSWNQSRHYLPGWYGLGSALDRIAREDAALWQTLRNHADDWTILRNALYNAETSLASASPELMADYAALVPDEANRATFLNRILDEYRRTEDRIEQLFNGPRETRRPRMMKTLLMRDTGLRRLHRRQIDLLGEWRAAQRDGNEDRSSQLLQPLLLSVNAIAAGLRTTG